jgi:hypothetical protein
MPSTWSPKRTEVNPGQGDLFSGGPQHLQPNPHFQPDGEVARGVAVSLSERNEALVSTLTLLGRLSANASFRDQRHRSGTRARRSIEGSYRDSDDLEEAFIRAEGNKVSLESAIEASLRQAFGFDSLVSSELYPELTEGVVNRAFRSGDGVNNGHVRPKPGHKEGIQEFKDRFQGSNNRTPRTRLKQTLGRQATQIMKVKTGQAKKAS